MKARLLAVVFILASIFCLMARTNIEFTRVLSFDGTNGAKPEATLTLGNDGNFYGTTRYGGKYDKGTIYRFTTNETLQTIFSFDGTNAGEPFAELVQGRGGMLFGTCRSGDVFSILPDGSGFKSLRHFAYENVLLTGISLGPDDNVYGVVPYGGINREGAIFRLTPEGDFKIIMSFDFAKTCGGDCHFIWGQDGAMYGTSSGSFKYEYGNFFRLTTNGDFTVLASMTETNSFRAFYNDLMQGKDGGFYETTQFGGEFDSKVELNDGTGNGYFFKVTTNGTFKTLASFSGWAGAHPQGRLVQGRDGNFYGVTFGGTIFRATPAGEITPIFHFFFNPYGDSMTNGFAPCGLTMAGDGKTIYGTTTLGGEKAHLAGYASGTIFKFRIESPADNHK